MGTTARFGCKSQQDLTPFPACSPSDSSAAITTLHSFRSGDNVTIWLHFALSSLRQVAQSHACIHSFIHGSMVGLLAKALMDWGRIRRRRPISQWGSPVSRSHGGMAFFVFCGHLLRIRSRSILIRLSAWLGSAQMAASDQDRSTSYIHINI